MFRWAIYSVLTTRTLVFILSTIFWQYKTIGEMKTTLTVQSIHTGVKMKLTFESEQARNSWIETQGHNYVLKGFKTSK